MRKSATVTVRESPGEDVATATVAGLTIHGQPLVVQTDQRVDVLGLWQRRLMAELDGPRARSLRIQIIGIA